jgi:2-iminobutanoate/2-iminopropanoate deaminase
MSTSKPRPFSPQSGRRDLMGAAVCGAAGVLALTGRSAWADVSAAEPGAGDLVPVSFAKSALRPAGAPSADVGYSPAILTQGQRLLFISGQGPEDLEADIETQIRQTFDRIGILLQAAGATFANVAIIRSYWVHMLRDVETFRKVRKDYLVEPYPASTAVGTPELAIPGLEFEIEAVAIL